jgi:hypothetical protein
MPDLRIKPYNSQTWYTLRDVPSISCNWEINRAGMLTASVPFPQVTQLLATIRNAGYTNVQTLAGMVCEFSDPSAGTWGGKVMQYGGADGMAQISAMSYEILLRKTLVYIDTRGNVYGGKDDRGHPGRVLKQVISIYNSQNGGDSEVQARTPINLGTPFDIVGDDVDVGIIGRMDAYDDILPICTEDIGYEFNTSGSLVNNAVTAYFAERLGSVKTTGTNAVTLVEGTHISAASWQDDASTIVNSLRGTYITETTKTKGKGKKAKTITTREFETVTDDTSKNQFGLLQESRTFGRMKKDAAKRQLTNEINRLKVLEPLITVEIPNVDNIWARFTHGDTVNLQLGNTGYAGTFRVMVRSLDAVRGVMVCSGYGDKRTG